MFRKLSIARALAVSLTTAAFLSACGGGSDSSNDDVDVDGNEPLSVSVVSTESQAVTGDDALIAIARSRESRGKGVDRFDAGSLSPDDLSVTLNGNDVTSSFRLADLGSNGTALLGRVDDLALGDNTLSVKAPGSRSQSLMVISHPITGPVFSGPQEQPFICETQASGLGMPLDEDCSIATRTDYFYLSSSNDTLKPLDPDAERPEDVATTTTSEGKTVAMIVRRDTGTINRAIYQTAILDDPAEPGPDPWTRTAGWNGRLVYLFGGGCGPGYHQGNINTIDALDPGLLGQGYAVATSTLNVLNVNCNDVLSAETALMVKEHFTETYGLPLYTIGRGGSGGAIQQHMIADNYPGILDGITPSASFPDNLSIGPGINDCPLLLASLDRGDVTLTGEQRRQVSGFGNFGYCQAWAASFAPLIQPSACPAIIPDELIYDAVDNPKGVRCTSQDHYKNILGVDPDTGFAPPLFDNQGVQYGLQALNNGVISIDEFLDLNAAMGGYDIDGNIIADRSVVDTETLKTLYGTGRIVAAGAGLETTPIIDFRSYRDQAVDIHDSFRSHSMRARLRNGNGDAGNQIISVADGGVAQGDPIGQMDRWLAAIRADDGDTDLAAKVSASKPTDVVDACYRDDGTKLPQTITADGSNECSTMFPFFGDPRTAAGAPLANDIAKCSLKPVDTGDYAPAVVFSDAQAQRLQGIFPDGVCDWSQPGVGQVPLRGTWLSFAPPD